MAALAAAVPPVEGPCLADEPADRDDGVGKVEECAAFGIQVEARVASPNPRAATPSDGAGSCCTAANSKTQARPKERTHLDDSRHG